MKNICRFVLIGLFSTSLVHASNIGHVVADQRSATLSAEECKRTFTVVTGVPSCAIKTNFKLNGGDKIFSVDLPEKMISKSTALTADVVFSAKTITLIFSTNKFLYSDLLKLMDPYKNYTATVEWIQYSEDTIDHS